MFAHLTRLSTEHTRKIVPRVLEDAVKSRALSTVSARAFHLSCLGTIQCTSRALLSSQSRSMYTLVKRPTIISTPEHVRSMLPCFSITCRGIKTRKSAAKRFIKTGTGELKYGHAGKRHNTSKKSKTRQRRLNQLVRFIPFSISQRVLPTISFYCCLHGFFPI